MLSTTYLRECDGEPGCMSKRGPLEIGNSKAKDVSLFSLSLAPHPTPQCSTSRPSSVLLKRLIQPWLQQEPKWLYLGSPCSSRLGSPTLTPAHAVTCGVQKHLEWPWGLQDEAAVLGLWRGKVYSVLERCIAWHGFLP